MDCPAPLTSELESSAVSSVYAAIEEVDFDSAGSKEDLDEMIGDIISAIDEVASDYESNEMFDKNPDLQERAEILRSAEDELGNWADSLGEPPEEREIEDRSDDRSALTVVAEDDEAHDEWMDEARQAAKDAVDNLELP